MPVSTERVLFVHAQPHDESMSTGGTISALVDAGAQVTVVTCTRGELAAAVESGLGHESAAALRDPAELREQRDREHADALRILGVADHRYLGDPDARWPGRRAREYLDSGVHWDESGRPRYLDVIDPRSLLAADPGEVAADIASVISAVDPSVVVSYDPSGGYRHPDQVRAQEAARRAAEVLGVAYYAIVPAAASRAATVTMDVSEVLERKRAAIAAHGSRLSVVGDNVTLPPEQGRPIERIERYRRVRRDREGNEFSNQSMFGKIGTSVVTAAIGFITGALLTVIHQSSALMFGVPVPWGIITAVLVTAALLTGLRLVFETRIVPGVAAAGILGAVALLSLQGAGGSVLVPGNEAGYTWTFAPTVIAIVVLAWPRPGRRR